MKRLFLPHRALALWLAVSLAVATPALALRQRQPETNEKRAGLEDALREEPARPRPAPQAGMEEGIPLEAVLAGLRGIQGALAEINRELDPDQRLLEEDFSEGVINQYAEAVAGLNGLIENGPMSAEALELEFFDLHRQLGYRGVVTLAGRYDPQRLRDLRDLFEDLFSEEGRRGWADDPARTAAHVFARLVSLQGFTDGNKRAASLITNYILLQRGRRPLILTPGNVVRYRQIVDPVLQEEEPYVVDEDQFLEFLEDQIGPAAGMGDAPRAGMEEDVAEARRQLISFINDPVIRDVLKTLKPTYSTNESISLADLFEERFNHSALRAAGFEVGIAQMLGKGIWDPAIRLPEGTFPSALRIHVQPGTVWHGGVQQQLDQAVEDGLIQLVDAESAQIVVAEADLRADPLTQILVQVDRNSAGTVTPGLLRYIEGLHQEGSIEAGAVIVLYRRGDLDEDVYLFA